MRRILVALAAACVLILAACGGTAPRTAAAACPVGNSPMGCAVRAAERLAPRSLTVPAGRRFIDVSDWQPTVNWRAVRLAGVFGVIVKAGEGVRPDPTFTEHVAGARAAGLQVQAYWFVRPDGCNAEAAAIRRYSAGLPVALDMEVPGIAGYAYCLRSVAHSVYTSPGTWAGGSTGGLPLWQAEYGPTLHPVWQPVRAWQYTDAASIAGLHLDESVDYGLFAKPKPPLPVCIHRRMTRAACSAAKARIASDERAAASSQRTYVARGCGVLAQRVAWFGSQLRRQPRVRTASRRRALASSRAAYAQRSCAVFSRRAEFFTARAVAIGAAS